MSPDVRESATLLHVDMDAFFASVEILRRPELANVPLIVGGNGRRGVVASCNYEARRYGIRSAMNSAEAKRRCPQAVFLPGKYSLYEEYSARLHAVLESFTPLVEGLSLDEAFLDVDGAQRLFGSPFQIATAIRNAIREKLSLDACVGAANTKHVAKLASVAAKPRAAANGIAPGAGVVVVEPGEALDFLHALPIRAIWGVGPASESKLSRLGIKTVGELAHTDERRLASVIGEGSAAHLLDLAWNRDPRTVVTSRAAKSVGHEQTFSDDIRTFADAHVQVVRLADAVAARLRSRQLEGRTVTTKIRFGDFRTITRSVTLDEATSNAGRMADIADGALREVDFADGVRLLGLSLSNLGSSVRTEQMELGQTVEPDDELDRTIDLIRSRYGNDSVVPAPLLTGGRDRAGAKAFVRGERQWGPTQETEDDDPGSKGKARG